MRAPIRLPPKRTGILDLTPVEFSAQSKARLAQVNPALAELMLRVEAQHPDAFEITEGMRDAQRQAQMVAEGKSQTLNSRHLTGNAVDIAMIGPGGKPNWTFEDYQPIAETAKATAASLGIPDFVWGGDWKTLRDAVHFQVGGPQQGGAANNLTVSSKGGTGMGLLDMPPQQPQTFGQRLGQDFRSGELMDRLAVAFNSMRMNPDQGIGALVENRQARRETAAQRNATVEWLRSRGQDDLAAAMQAGASPQDVLAESVRRMQPANPLDAINLQKAQLELQQMQNPQPGFRRATPEESAAYGAQAGQFGPDGRFYAEEVAQPEGAYRQVTGAELGLTGPEAKKMFNVSPTNQVTAIGGAGTTVTNVIGGEGATSAMNKKLAEAEGTLFSTYLQQGPIASAALQDLSLLQEILPMAPQGPIVGKAAELFPGFSSAGAAATSVIKRVAPTLRVEGSGSSSDIEYNGMLQSLPSLVNYPEANAAIVAMMQAKAQINRERSELVRSYANSAQTEEDAKALRARLSELDARSIMTPELRAIIGQLGGVPQGGAGSGAGQPTMTPEQAARILLEAP